MKQHKSEFSVQYSESKLEKNLYLTVRSEQFDSFIDHRAVPGLWSTIPSWLRALQLSGLCMVTVSNLFRPLREQLKSELFSSDILTGCAQYVKFDAYQSGKTLM